MHGDVEAGITDHIKDDLKMRLEHFPHCAVGTVMMHKLGNAC